MQGDVFLPPNSQIYLANSVLAHEDKRGVQLHDSTNIIINMKTKNVSPGGRGVVWVLQRKRRPLAFFVFTKMILLTKMVLLCGF